MGMGIPAMDAAMTCQRCKTISKYYKCVHDEENVFNAKMRDFEEKMITEYNVTCLKEVMNILRSESIIDKDCMVMGDDPYCIEYGINLYRCFFRYGLIVILCNEKIAFNVSVIDFVVTYDYLERLVEIYDERLSRSIDPYRFYHRHLDGGMDNGEDVKFTFDGKDFCVQIHNDKMYCVCKTTEVIIYSKLISYNEIEPLSLSHFIGESIQIYLSNPHCIFHALNGGMNFVDYEEKIFETNQLYVENLGFFDDDCEDGPHVIFSDEKSLDGFVDNLVLEDKEQELDAILDVAIYDPEDVDVDILRKKKKI